MRQELFLYEETLLTPIQMLAPWAKEIKAVDDGYLCIGEDE